MRNRNGTTAAMDTGELGTRSTTAFEDHFMATALQFSPAEHHMAVTDAFLGTNGREFGKSVLHALDTGNVHVVVDCAGWRRLDFVLLSALVKCADAFTHRGAELELVNLSTEMRANIRELRLEHRLRIAE